jgi:hypothetical protein
VGVTIHFEGRLKSPAALAALESDVRAFAKESGWLTKPISESNALLKRVVNEQNDDYVGPTRGIEVQPHPNSEPLRFEFDRGLFVQEYCKTQFAGATTHVRIVELLHRVVHHFEDLHVEDEGEFWETQDEVLLERHIDKVNGLIDEMLRENRGAKGGPIRLASGRIVDVTT